MQGPSRGRDQGSEIRGLQDPAKGTQDLDVKPKTVRKASQIMVEAKDMHEDGKTRKG